MSRTLWPFAALPLIALVRLLGSGGARADREPVRKFRKSCASGATHPQDSDNRTLVRGPSR